ncbi:PLP-dependent aminotransferase family protein [Granulicella sp. L60]|uniref:aminotransferase-like domain-containing protein n=1 Tax=Granulicella sp. L60 TaxID=1641866 RepID=UPI00131DA4A2|nr:PLP-dependent aminotransferase family protein [Granulicella sp. L60]
MGTRHQISLKVCFSDPLLDGMNILNEVVLDFPEAISFAPGRPMERFFDLDRSLEGLGAFVAKESMQNGKTEDHVKRVLGQYGRTNGFIAKQISELLRQDEDISAPHESIVITVGAQEAMAILMLGLFEPGKDILLTSNPTYIGITGLARILGIKVVGVTSDESGIVPLSLVEAIQVASEAGRVRALYDIPDFNNPLGSYLPLERRKEILEICKRNEVFLIEDNPYGMFLYEGKKLPTLKSLDSHGTVIYIGSFSKTIFPSLRVGFLVADQIVSNENHFLAQELSKIKSLLTVNTSGLSQAIVAGILIEERGSLKSLIQPQLEQLRRNRDALLSSLSIAFEDLVPTVSWNRPVGGFFLTLTIPFTFGIEEMYFVAKKYGVIACPMSLFTIGSGCETQIRLAFSYLDPSQIENGVRALASYVRDRLPIIARR